MQVHQRHRRRRRRCQRHNRRRREAFPTRQQVRLRSGGYGQNALTSEYRAPTKDKIAAYVKAARDVVTIFHEKMYDLKRQILSVPVELAPSNDALYRSFLRMDVFYCDNCKKIVAKYLDFIHVVEPDKHGIFDSVFGEFSGMGKNCSCWAAQNDEKDEPFYIIPLNKLQFWDGIDMKSAQNMTPKAQKPAE